MSKDVFERLESEVRYYSRAFPAVFERAKGAELWDVEGTRRIDFFAGAGALNYGHAPPDVIDAVVAYLKDGGIVHALDGSTKAKAQFLERFEQVVLAPRKLDYKVQFCSPAGTDAVEAALKLVRKVTGRTGVVSFSGAYHGKTLGALGLSGGAGARRAAGVPLHDVTFLPFFDGPHGPFDSVGLLRRYLEDSSSGVAKPAAVFFEPVQMEGGIFPAPPEALRALRALCDEHDILLVADEIQTGCGRLGPFFAFEEAGIVPDLVTVSKSIGGAGFPMALVLLKRSLDAWKPGEHTGTFRGHQLSFVAAHAALARWTDDTLPRETARKGKLVEQALRPWVTKSGGEAVLRGAGLAWGVDLSRLGPDRASSVSHRAFDLGLVLEACGRDDTVLKIMPPLVIDDALLEEGLGLLLRALDDAP